MDKKQRLLRTHRAYRTILAIGLSLWVGIALLCTPMAAKAQFENEELEELILSVQVGQYLLSDGVLAYQYQGRFYLPIIQLSEEFSFFTDPDLGRGAVSGWAGTEDNTFVIDTERGEVTIRGEKQPLSETEVLSADLVGGDDLYVQQELLARIWPVNPAVNLPNLSIDILVDEEAKKLPFMARMERKAKQKIATAKKEAKAEEKPKDYVYTPNPYRPIGLPVLDLETRYDFGTAEDDLTNFSTVSGVMDLLWAKADFSASSRYAEKNLKGPDTIRLRLEREATRDEPLPLGLKQIESGDTRVRTPPLIKNGTSGRGAVFTTTDTKRSSEFDNITVEGTGPPGWEVELYRNAELLDFTTVDGRGEYRFEDVRLNFGNNQIRRVLYGPQGQIREQVDEYVFGANMLRPGQFDYTVGAVDAEKDLIRLREDPNSGNKIHGLAAGAEAAYGIHRNATVYGSVSTLPVKNNRSEDEIRDYVSVGTALSLPFGVAQAEAYQDVSRDKDIEKKGRALDTRFITEILGFKLNLRSAFFNDFESPVSGFGNSARKFLGEAGIQRNFQLPFAQLSLGLDYDHNRSVDGNTRTSVSARQSISRGATRFSNNIITNWNNGKQSSSSGQISASTRIKQVRLRTNLNYNIKPESNLSSLDAEARYSPTKRLSTALTANHNLLESTSGGGIQLSYDFDKILASIEGNWQQNQGFTFGVRASSSLGPYGPNGKYMMRAERLSSSSPAAGRVFMDNDADGKFSEGDEPIPEAEITVNGRSNKIGADENGYVTSFEGSGIEEANIEVDRSSLLDPYHMPAIDGYTTTLRPGSMPYFEFPVIETGAIDGTALRDNGEPLQGMRLELVNAKGEVVAKTETAYDGFYTFEYVPPGQYTVRADPSYEVNVPPQSVAVSSEELFASGIDLQLLEQAVEAEAEEADAGALGEADVTAAPESDASADEAEGESGEVAHTNHESEPETVQATTKATGTGQPAPFSSDGEFLAIVQRVRIGEHPDRIRLVLDLSGPVQYTLEAQPGGTQIRVDLPGVAWDAMRTWQGKTTPVLAGYAVEALPDGKGTRLILTAHGTISAGLNGVLPPEEGQGYRLYLDLGK